MPEDKKEKTITLEQFRAWLEGVEEMQEEGWAPDVRQWTKIRERIDMIQSTPSQPQQVVHAPQPTQQTFFPPPQQSVFEPQGEPPPKVKLNPQAPIADDPTGKIPVKTPDIDSTKGYESTFE